MIPTCFSLIKRAGSTWSKISPAPVKAFSIEDFKVCKESFLKEQRPLFHSFSHDLYDMRRDQIEFLVKQLPKHLIENREETWKQYFLKGLHAEEIQFLAHQLPEAKQKCADY